MFHLILTACIADSSQACLPVLLPAGDAPDRAACEAAAPGIARDWLAAHPGLSGNSTDCRDSAALDALPMQQLAPGLWFHQGQIDQITRENRGRIANLSFVLGDDTVAVIDAGASREQGQQLYAKIRQVTDKPISHLILTHMHPDHSLGASVFAEAGAQVIGHPHLPDALHARWRTYRDNFDRIVGPQAMIGTSAVTPQPVPAEGMQIDLGGTVLRLTPMPTAHTDNDLMVHDPRSDTLFTGDLVFRGLTPVVDGSLNGWLGWMETPPDPQPARIIPGHGPVAASWDEATQAQARLLTTLRDATRARIVAGTPISQAVPEIAHEMQHLGVEWAAFDDIIPRDATAAYKELEWE